MKRNYESNRRAQTSGPLQNIMIALVIVAAATLGMFQFYSSLGGDYGVVLTNESAFTAYNDTFSDVQSTANSMSSKLSEATGLDIIVTAVTGGYQLLIDFLQAIPQLFNSVGASLLAALGIGSEYVAYFYIGVLIVILFAIVALALKVRG